mmetsp:Transcript_26842/g.50874  ORF Transcript_26842/g.50874 Transcript_26842/m.50874 type:complete len:371 (+) Transcript_26842:81-1193(+)
MGLVLVSLSILNFLAPLLLLLFFLPSTSWSQAAAPPPQFESQADFEVYFGHPCLEILSFPFYTCCNAFCVTCPFSKLCPCDDTLCGEEVIPPLSVASKEAFRPYVSPLRDTAGIIEAGNSQSEPPGLTSTFNAKAGGVISLSGYQTFDLVYSFAPPYINIRTESPDIHYKASILSQTLSAVSQRYPGSPVSYADVGTSNGALLHVASVAGASPILGVDHDVEYARNSEAAVTTLHAYLNVVLPSPPPLSRPLVVRGNLQTQPFGLADVVSCFALMHWAYSATASFRNLDGLVGHMAKLSKKATLIQWIAPSDSAIQYLNHISLNGGSTEGPDGYNEENFVKALNKHCGGVEDLGSEDGRETRRTYLCWAK